MAREQDATALNQARDAQLKLEATRQKTIEDLAKLGRATSATMVRLGVSLGTVTPETLVEEVGHLPGVV
jgi:4-hydroxy-3-methylbut-2-enyl diphosphate reductase IspH